MLGYKGFDKDLKCRNLQYEVGKTVEVPEAELCRKGLHFCTFPLDVFGFYPPAFNRFCEIEADDVTDEAESTDSKRVCKKLTIKAEIGLPGLIKAGVEYIKKQVDWENAKASNDQDRSAATNTGDMSAAVVEGKESVACALGIEGKAKGALGCWLVLAEWKEVNPCDWYRISVRSFKVDGKRIKADTYYMLRNGKAVLANRTD